MNNNPDEQCLLLKGNLNKKSNMAGATCVAGIAYRSGAPVHPRFLVGFMLHDLFCLLCNILKIIVCPFVLFILPMVVSIILRFMAFGIFKLFCVIFWL